MSRQYPVVNVATYTFNNWIERTNDIIVLVNTDVVTVESNTAGDLTVGNGYVIGIFGSNTLTATTIRGGTVDTNTEITVASNTIFSGSQINATSNAYILNTNTYIDADATTLVSNTYLQSNSTQRILSVTGNATHYGISANVNNNFTLTGNAIFNNFSNFVNTATFDNSIVIGTTSEGVNANTSKVVVGNNTVNTTLTSTAVQTNTSTSYNLFVTNEAQFSGALLNATTNVHFTNVNTYIDSDRLVLLGNSYFQSNGTQQVLSVVTNATHYGVAVNVNNDFVITGNTLFHNTVTFETAPEFEELIIGDIYIDGTQISVGNSTVNTLITSSTIETNTATFTTLNVTGEIFGTVSPSTNFVPTTNNILTIGTSSNVFNRSYVTNAYSNSISSFSGTLSIVSNTNVTGFLSVNSNNYISSGLYTFTTTSQATIDSFAIATYRSGEYLIQMSDGSTNQHVTKLIVYHDGSTAYATEYGQMFNVSSLGIVTVDISAGSLRVRVTPASSSVVVKYSRNLLTV